ncbi:aquaporin-like protein [Dentipellis sp. KUC8613]|nr:aquaporin-like protein [Dentipellis sp. KUC8613]
MERTDFNTRPVHLADYQERPRIFQAWERVRHSRAQWVIDCVSEALGVFFYCFAGVGATAPFVLGNLLELPNIGSLFTVGFGYAIGIGLAISICSSQNGGHFNPAVTITAVLFKKYPVKTAARHIFAQILGGYIACLLIYLQWKQLITETEAGLAAKGKLDAIQFTPNGPAGIIAVYATPGSSLGIVFINEFVNSFVIALVIWACVDPTNHFLPPVVVPWVIGLTYAIAIWGYSPVGLAANSARDIGGRLAALTIWGTKASGGSYAALAALTNIPATILAYIVYEVCFADSSRVLQPCHRTIIENHRSETAYRRNMQMYGSVASTASDIGNKDLIGHREAQPV